MRTEVLEPLRYQYGGRGLSPHRTFVSRRLCIQSVVELLLDASEPSRNLREQIGKCAIVFDGVSHSPPTTLQRMQSHGNSCFAEESERE